MFPWLWFYAPHYQLPWSGNWRQNIDPDTSFFSAIKPSAGDAAMEQKLFDVASYGRQLGWITEVLLGQQADAQAQAQAKAADSLAKLRRTAADIEWVKQQGRAGLVGLTAAAIERLREADPAALQALLARALEVSEKKRPATPALPAQTAIKAIANKRESKS